MRFLSTCAISFRNFYIISDIINEKKKEVEHDKNCNMWWWKEHTNLSFITCQEIEYWMWNHKYASTDEYLSDQKEHGTIWQRIEPIEREKMNWKFIWTIMKNKSWTERWNCPSGRVLRIALGHWYSLDLFMMWIILI